MKFGKYIKESHDEAFAVSEKGYWKVLNAPNLKEIIREFKARRTKTAEALIRRLLDPKEEKYIDEIMLKVEPELLATVDVSRHLSKETRRKIGVEE